MEHKYKSGVTYNCRYNVVWCSKYCRKVLTDGAEARLEEVIRDTCIEIDAEIIEMEIAPNYVRLLVSVDPHLGIHRAVKQLKRKSSRILREEFPWTKSRLPTLWTNSYFVSTFGDDSSKEISEFIEHQKSV